jgi:hypothetical protein
MKARDIMGRGTAVREIARLLLDKTSCGPYSRAIPIPKMLFGGHGAELFRLPLPTR